MTPGSRRQALLGLCLLAAVFAVQLSAAALADFAPHAREEQGARPPSRARGPVHIAYLCSDGNLPGIAAAYATLLRAHPELDGRVRLTFLTESVFDDIAARDMTSADVLLLDIMNEQMLARFDEQHRTNLIADVARHGTVLAVGEGLLPKAHYVERGAVWDEAAREFWTHAGQSNQLGLLTLALTRAGVSGLEVPAPQPSLDFGYYYPDGAAGRVFATWQAFDEWRATRNARRPGATRVAIGFYKSTYYTGDTALLNRLIAEVERRGAEAIPIFGYPGAVASERLLLDEAGQPRADVMLGFFFNFADPEASTHLARIGIPIVNLVSLYGRSEAEWRASANGMSEFEGTFQVAVPELAGTIAPTVVGSKEKQRDPVTGLTLIVTNPIESRVITAVSRALRYAALRARPNAEKHVALLFYNYPPGKANIGASYLNVAESLANILQRLRREGYDVGSDADLSADRILRDITTRARNVASDAPGELDEMLREGTAVRVSLPEYRRWLQQYPAPLRDKILKDWGPPERTTLMRASGSDPGLVIPVVRYGSIALLPQPSRGWGEDAEKMYHAKDLAPHHQYVAAYAWLREGFKADAVVHLGTHGTLEWLDGKDTGLSEADAPDALIADLPDLYIYNVDVVGEGLVARRRGMATLIDHMTPPFTKGGLYADLAALSELIDDHDAAESRNAQLAGVLAGRIQERAIALGLAKDLGLDSSAAFDDEAIHRLRDYLVTLKGQNIPYGLHAFGRLPDKAMRDSTVEAIVSVDRSLLPSKATVLAADMEQRIVTSAARELDQFVAALAGRFVPGGPGGEPIRNPDAYPTGKNFYGIDPDKVPKPASWTLGVTLADQMLKDYVAKHGDYPHKVSFVIWGDETMRHEGVVESQIFHLLGTKPVWDARGKVVDVEVVPRARLGRPRVDIVIASAAEGMFHNVTVLMDRAVQKVKALDEADNLVRQHSRETKARLIAQGRAEAEAERLSGVRIFDEPPGRFNLNTSTIVAASGTWDTDKGFADDYIRKLGHGFGNGFWGEAMPDVFRLALSGVDQVVHSSSTTLYGGLDNDDMFMYVGGLAAAVRSIDGASPSIVVTNTRDPGKPQMTTIDRFLGEEFRSRYVNPTWIAGMQKEGYAGAGAMREFVEYLWGWDATVSNSVSDQMWQETFDVYVEDARGLDMKRFFERASPYAFQDITARMLETVRKGSWQADARTEARLLAEYVASVNAHGASGAGQTSRNPRLMKFVLDRGAAAGVPVPALEAFAKTMAQAIGRPLSTAVRDAESFVTRNEARASGRSTRSMPRPLSPAPSPSPVSVPAPATATAEVAALSGFVIEAETRDAARKPAPDASARDHAATGSTHGAWTAMPFLALLLIWRARRRRRLAIRGSGM